MPETDERPGTVKAISMPQSLSDILDLLARTTGFTVSRIVRDALRSYIPELISRFPERFSKQQVSELTRKD